MFKHVETPALACGASVTSWRDLIKWAAIVVVLFGLGVASDEVWHREQTSVASSSAPWLTITRDPTATWAVDSVVALDDTQSGGRVNIYATTVGADGTPLSGIVVVQSWPTGSAPQATIAGTTDWPQSGDSSFDPSKGQVGPYCVRVQTSSEKVCGMGLPLKRHWVYNLTFRKRGSAPVPTGSPTTATAAPPGSSTPGVTSTPGGYVTKDVLIGAANAFIDYLRTH